MTRFGLALSLALAAICCRANPDPATATQASAQSTHVDQVMAPDDIAAAIAALRPSDTVESTRQLQDDARGVDAILKLLRDEYAIDFSHYKAGTVTRRIERRLAFNRAIDIDTYVQQLHSDPRELSSLYEDLLIGVTRFFRDNDAFAALEHRIIPDLVERGKSEEQIRVWVPGCATGQEAYSIAILLHERLAARQQRTRVKILATDVHKASLEVASAAVYSAEQISGIDDARLQRFFTIRPNGYQISAAIRESIVFAPHNLIRDAPFTKMDLIACRNLLIYFQPHAAPRFRAPRFVISHRRAPWTGRWRHGSSVPRRLGVSWTA